MVREQDSVVPRPRRARLSAPRRAEPKGGNLRACYDVLPTLLQIEMVAASGLLMRLGTATSNSPSIDL